MHSWVSSLQAKSSQLPVSHRSQQNELHDCLSLIDSVGEPGGLWRATVGRQKCLFTEGTDQYSVVAEE